MFKKAALLICLFVLFYGLSACDQEQKGQTASNSSDLSADATITDMVTHIRNARLNARSSRALTTLFPDMTEETGYKVLMASLEADEKSGRLLKGYKLGGTVVKQAGQSASPVFGYSTDEHYFTSGQMIDAAKFPGGSVMVEAEICFIIGSDLTGPEISRADVEKAIESVCASIELISFRVLPVSDDNPESKTMSHNLADNVSHGGVILGEKRVKLSDIDLLEESVTGYVNGEEKTIGYGRYVMDGDAIAAIHWLANELLKHNRYLRAGDFIVTGSLFDNPTIAKGDKAEVRFSTLGSVFTGLQ